MAKAGENNLINDENVTEVVKAYHEVKNTYYQMLIVHRIKKKANTEIGNGGNDEKIWKKAKDLYTKADNLAKELQPKDQDPPEQKELKEELKGLATALATAVGKDDSNGETLRKALSNLKSAAETNHEQIVEKAQDVIKHYGLVKEAYKKVTEKEEEYKKLRANSEFTLVKSAFNQLETKFGTLQKSYENVLKLRVQELSDKADTLSTKAGQLPASVPDLKTQATALKEAASQPIGQQGLKEKADDLVNAINDGGDTDGTKAGDVIKQFDTVTEKYEKLIAKATEKGKQANVKAVYDAYTNLKSLYDQILNFAKVKYYATQVETKAKLITSPDTPKQFEDKLDAFGNVYNSIPAADIKSTVQNDFEYIKNVVYEAQSEKMQL